MGSCCIHVMFCSEWRQIWLLHYFVKWLTHTNWKLQRHKYRTENKTDPLMLTISILFIKEKLNILLASISSIVLLICESAKWLNVKCKTKITFIMSSFSVCRQQIKVMGLIPKEHIYWQNVDLECTVIHYGLKWQSNQKHTCGVWFAGGWGDFPASAFDTLLLFIHFLNPQGYILFLLLVKQD